jgi:hypothetical protein
MLCATWHVNVIARFRCDPLVALCVVPQALHRAGDDEKVLRITMTVKRNRDASGVLPFGRLWYGEPNAVSNAVEYAKFYSRSHDAVIQRCCSIISGPLSATFGARRRASTLPEPFLIDPEIDESGFQQSRCDSVRTTAFNEVA